MVLKRQSRLIAHNYSYEGYTNTATKAPTIQRSSKLCEIIHAESIIGVTPVTIDAT